MQGGVGTPYRSPFWQLHLARSRLCFILLVILVLPMLKYINHYHHHCYILHYGPPGLKTFFFFSLYVLVSTSTYAAEALPIPPSVRQAVDCTYSRPHRTFQYQKDP
jgi:hypothetical protein